MMNANGESFWPSMKGNKQIMVTDDRGCFLQGMFFCHKILFKFYAQTPEKPKQLGISNLPP